MKLIGAIHATFQGFGLGVWRNRIIVSGVMHTFWCVAVGPITLFYCKDTR